MNISKRLRRMRNKPSLRGMVCETRVTMDDLVQPVFVDDNLKNPRPISSLPGMSAYPIDHLEGHIGDLSERGVKAVMVFGIPSVKDPQASSAFGADGISQRAVERIKETSDMIVMADACLCEYTDHGHCGILKDGRVDEVATLPILGQVAVSLADAGADIIAPSGMMDGAVCKMRESLDDSGHDMVPMMSYAAKFHSALYGPFREAACSAPKSGDRSSYQIDPANRREAILSVDRDIEDGADIIMVKPALSSLDIISACRSMYDRPLAAYQVSGEYAMVMNADAAGILDGRKVMIETLTAIKRAGADIIVSYYSSSYLDSSMEVRI